MTDPIKRLNYFDHQFLHAADFADEQSYHLSMRRRHNRVLHTSGIAEGLEVSFNQGESKVSVQPGTAYDGNGREIIVLDKTDVDLQALASDATAYLTIRYGEQPSDSVNAAGVTGDTRMTEAPVIEFATTPPNNPTMSLILAVVARKGKLIDSLDASQRPIAGAKAGDLVATSLSFRTAGASSNIWPKMSSMLVNQAPLTVFNNTSLQLDANRDLILFDGGQVRSSDSSYRLSFNSAGKRLELQTATGTDMTFLTGGTERMRLLSNGNLGIGTNAPDLPLTIQSAGGAYMDFRGYNGSYLMWVGADANGGLISTMSNHDLNLRAGANQPMLTIKASGNVGIGMTNPATRLDVADRVRIRQGPSGPATLSFYQATPAADIVTLAMLNDTQFGLYSPRTGRWGWVFDTTTGNVGLGGITSPVVRLDLSGGELRWGNSSRLTSDQGGSLELGGDSSTLGVGSPYIDFHFSGRTQDFSVRLQNDADGRLTFSGTTLQVNGNLGLGIGAPTNRLHVSDFTGIRQNYLYMSGGSGWSSLGYNCYHNGNNNGWVFPDTSQPAITVEMDNVNYTSPRFEIYATSPSAPTSFAKRFGVNCVNGALYSPMWNINQVMNTNNGTLPRTSSTFTTGGGTLLIFASGSGWSNNPSTLIGAYIYLDYSTSPYWVGGMYRYANEAGSHKTFNINPLVVRGIAAGTHSITLVAYGGTQTDYNDYFNITVLELPF